MNAKNNLKNLRYEKLLDPSRCQAVRLVQWTNSLRDCGVQTPELQLTGNANAISMDYIHGMSARCLSPLIFDNRSTEHVLEKLIRPLVAIHRVRFATGLKPYDPFWRITPRLRNLKDFDRSKRAIWLHIYQLLQDQYNTSAGKHTTTTLHGDYHLGQLIINNAVWVLDLEDLSIGPPEVDLSNFCAHMATTEAFPPSSAFSGYFRLLTLAGEIYASQNKLLNHYLLQLFGCISLLRRCLKLVEQGAGFDWQSNSFQVLQHAVNQLPVAAANQS